MEATKMALSEKDYSTFKGSSIYFSKRDKTKIEKMRGKITVISTVCPDYPNNGKEYTFRGQLGSGISLTARAHINLAPDFLKNLEKSGLEVSWIIFVADLPELVAEQTEFCLETAGSKEKYIRRCRGSALAIKKSVLFPRAETLTFSDFYGKLKIPYLEIQEGVAAEILKRANHDRNFANKFSYFVTSRMSLAAKFRQRRLSQEEYRRAGAHGMSLYITHGTLLRNIFLNQNLIVINHVTENLRNFFLCELVQSYGGLKDTPRFPVGIIDETWY